jgi:hypothetical protein
VVLPEHAAPAGKESANIVSEGCGCEAVIDPLVGVVTVAAPLIVAALAPVARNKNRAPVTIETTAARRSLVGAEPDLLAEWR